METARGGPAQIHPSSDIHELHKHKCMYILIHLYTYKQIYEHIDFYT